MNNTEMVSVQRELAEGIVRMLQGSGGWKTAEQLSAILAKPAEQPQGALAIPSECPHLIVFDDTEVEQLMFAGAGARTAALKKWDSISTSWNAHLFVRVARNSRDDGHPCATLADPGEVERLKGLIAAHMDASAEKRAELHKLRAQLAERDAQVSLLGKHIPFHEYSRLLEKASRSPAEENALAGLKELQARLAAVLASAAQSEGGAQ